MESSVIISSFSGAFFAFLFVRLGEFLNNILNRYKKHRNALIRMEQILNEYLSIITENKAQLDDFIKTIKNNGIWANDLQKMDIDKNLTLDLMDIDIVNEAFKVNVEVRRLNASIEIVMSRHKDLYERYLDNVRKKDFFLENYNELLPRVKELKKFHNLLDDKVIKLLSKTRVLLKIPSLSLHLSLKLLNFFKPSLNDKKINKEQEKLLKEIKSVKKESASEIREILKDK